MKYNLINKIIVKIQPKTIVFAHCDIPCGIYDPKAAEVAAETVDMIITQNVADSSLELPVNTNADFLLLCSGEVPSAFS